MNIGLPVRNINGVCGNGFRTSLMWVPSEKRLSLCVFHVSIINRTIANLVSILTQKWLEKTDFT